MDNIGTKQNNSKVPNPFIRLGIFLANTTLLTLTLFPITPSLGADVGKNLIGNLESFDLKVEGSPIPKDISNLQSFMIPKIPISEPLISEQGQKNWILRKTPYSRIIVNDGTKSTDLRTFLIKNIEAAHAKVDRPDLRAIKILPKETRCSGPVTQLELEVRDYNKAVADAFKNSVPDNLVISIDGKPVGKFSYGRGSIYPQDNPKDIVRELNSPVFSLAIRNSNYAQGTPFDYVTFGGIIENGKFYELTSIFDPSKYEEKFDLMNSPYNRPRVSNIIGNPTPTKKLAIPASQCGDKSEQKISLAPPK